MLSNEASRRPATWQRHLRWQNYVPFLRTYNSHPNRALFVLEHYSELLEGEILDVCCGTSLRYFKNALGKRYQGLDIGESYKYDDIADNDSDQSPDHICNIEREKIPFASQSFDTVLCIGALEHLENIHEACDELFRMARRRVIIQLPNNWPGFFSSMLVGHNFTHRAGYGLKAYPAKPGQRHKYFFNLEEACEFLVGRMPPGWNLRRLDFSYEKGCDSWFAWSLHRKARSFTYAKGVERFGRNKALTIALLRPWFYYPLTTAEWVLGLLIWGWQGKVAYHNITCREIWAIFDRLK